MKRREFLKTSSIAGGAVLSSWAGATPGPGRALPRVLRAADLRDADGQPQGRPERIPREGLHPGDEPPRKQADRRFHGSLGSNALNLFVLVPHPSLDSFLAPGETGG